MSGLRLWLPIAALFIAGCGGDTLVACDEGPYQAAVRAPKVVAPEGLDDLDPMDEVPLPEASPQEEGGYDGPCLESPPQVLIIE
ncbi:MAG: hypothetical protein QNI96_08910 [Woeseiaceae bacterium]|nr:hypothetical protein [Woeseiaceae bacterium]